MSDEGINDQLVLVGGLSATGKSASLRNLRGSVMYLNTEAGKRLPFSNKFAAFKITDPWQVHEAFDHAYENPGKYDVIVVDSLTFTMDMFETQYILPSPNTMKAWSDYAQYFKVLMQEKVARMNVPVIITAHVREDLDEKAMEMKTSVPIKGSLKNNGIEAYFSTVVATKKVSIKDLEAYGSDLLEITDEDRELGYKHVYQTRPTKTTSGERIRSPMGMFDRKQTFMDNDAQKLIDHLRTYYGT